MKINSLTYIQIQHLPLLDLKKKRQLFQTPLILSFKRKPLSLKFF